MKPYLITFVLILMLLVSLDSAFSQVGTKEIIRKDEATSSQKEPTDTRSRNPFLLPWGVYLLSKEGAGSAHREKVIGKDTKLEEMENPPFKVRAILISDQIRLATIGSQIVAVGDKVNDEMILEIKKDRVILGKGDKNRTLYLQQSPLRLTIEGPPPSPTGGEDRKGVEERKKGEKP
jgi:hypothetical protein